MTASCPKHKWPRWGLRVPAGRGFALINVLTVFILLTAALLFGFYLGSTVLGTQAARRPASRGRVFGGQYQPPDTSAAYRYQLNEPPPDPDSGPLASPAGRTVRDPFDRARRKPRSRPEQVHARPRNQRYTVQVGVFLKEENSQELMDDLRNRGYAGRVSTTAEDGQQVHKVQLGTYHTPQEAEQAARALREQGYQVRVTTQ